MSVVQQTRKPGRAECYEMNTEDDAPLWEVPPAATFDLKKR
jgi:hypothetical protein